MLSTIYQVFYFIGTNLLNTLLSLSVLSSGYLFWGFLKRRFGRRYAPDGQKTIIITGATSGLGLVMAKYFYHIGFSVIGTYFTELEIGYAQLKEISSTDDKDVTQTNARNRLFLVPLDITSMESIKETRQKIDQILDDNNLKLFTLVNMAGIASDGPFQWADVASVKKVVDTNLIGAMMFTRQFIFRIIKEKSRVVNVSSALHHIPCLTTSVYGSTKSGLAHFSDALHYDIRPYGASCRCLIPGNLMASTNIIFTRLAGTKKALESLSSEEKSYYQKSIRKSMAVFNSLAKEANLTSKLNLNELKGMYHIDDKQIGKLQEDSPIHITLIRRLIDFFDGSVGIASADNTYVTECFDNAIRLIDCPSRVYVGNFMYANYWGPMMDFVPYEIIQHILSAVYKFL